MSKSVKFLEVVSCTGMKPHTIFMAPKWVFDKVALGEELTDEDARFCVKSDWNQPPHSQAEGR